MDDAFEDRLLPRVVHRAYFDSTGVSVDDEPHRFGVVRPLGHDVYALLVSRQDGMVRNVHQDDLDAAGLPTAEGWLAATRNLQGLLDADAISRNVVETDGGLRWTAWFGHPFTSSCLMLPGLFDWCSRHVSGAEFFVCVPATDLMLVLQSAPREMLDDFYAHVAEGLAGAGNLVASHWFRLTASGLG